MKKTLYITIALAVSFTLWLALEAAGVGMAYTFYLVFCAMWIFGPWLVRGMVGRRG